MQSIKKFFDTFAVFLGSALRLSPVSWKSAAKSADTMRKVEAVFIATNAAGKAEKVETQTPWSFLADSGLQALGLIVGIWIITKVVSGFITLLPYLIVAALVLWLISYFTPVKAKPVAR